METQAHGSWWMGAGASGGLFEGLANVSLPRFLRVVLPLAMLFLVGVVFEYRVEVAADRAVFLTHETSIVQRGVRRIEGEVESSRGDLLMVADWASEVVESSGPGQLATLERSLLALVRRRPDYFQVRLISATGREMLRVESDSGGPRVVPARELQDKGRRSYFSEAMQLEPGQVYVSRMELNVERGVVEDPPRPVVRFATPIQDAAGGRQGIVVLNAHGDRFLRRFAASAERDSVQRMIVDSDGYWLRHRPEAEWGFALDHGQSFRQAFPEVWAQMAGRREGSAESAEGLFYFATADAASASEAAGDEDAGRGSWLLISLVPRDILNGIAIRAATRLLVIAVPLLFGLMLVGLLLAAALERRRLADDALRRLDRVRGVMMTASLDAIVVMDETGVTLEFNPAAQRIFGYTLEEARGRMVADLIIPAEHREAHHEGLKRYLSTGERKIIDQHITDLTGVRKNGEEFPVELTVCSMTLAGRHIFFGFLRDLSEHPAEETDPAEEERADTSAAPSPLAT